MSSVYSPATNEDINRIQCYMIWYHDTLKYKRGGRKAYKFRKTYKSHLETVKTGADVQWILADMYNYYVQLSAGYHRNSSKSSPSSMPSHMHTPQFIPVPFIPPTPPQQTRAMPAEQQQHTTPTAGARDAQNFQSTQNVPMQNTLSQATPDTSNQQQPLPGSSRAQTPSTTLNSPNQGNSSFASTSGQRVQFISPKSGDKTPPMHTPPPRDAKPEKGSLRGGSTGFAQTQASASPNELPSGWYIQSSLDGTIVPYPPGNTPFFRPQSLWQHSSVMNCPSSSGNGNGNALGLSGVAATPSPSMAQVQGGASMAGSATPATQPHQVGRMAQTPSVHSTQTPAPAIAMHPTYSSAQTSQQITPGVQPWLTPGPPTPWGPPFSQHVTPQPSQATTQSSTPRWQNIQPEQAQAATPSAIATSPCRTQELLRTIGEATAQLYQMNASSAQPSPNAQQNATTPQAQSMPQHYVQTQAEPSPISASIGPLQHLPHTTPCYWVAPPLMG